MFEWGEKNGVGMEKCAVLYKICLCVKMCVYLVVMKPTHVQFLYIERNTLLFSCVCVSVFFSQTPWAQGDDGYFR